MIIAVRVDGRLEFQGRDVPARFSPSRRVRFTSSDGTSADVEFKPGDIVWRDAEAHAGENTGTAECHVLQMELKHAKATPKKTK